MSVSNRPQKLLVHFKVEPKDNSGLKSARWFIVAKPASKSLTAECRIVFNISHIPWIILSSYDNGHSPISFRRNYRYNQITESFCFHLI